MAICPRQDGKLILKTVPQPGDTLLEYEVCPTCGGVWLRAFDANFLKSTDIEDLASQGQALRSYISGEHLSHQTQSKPEPTDFQSTRQNGESLLHLAQSKSEPGEVESYSGLHLTVDKSDKDKPRLKQEEVVTSQSSLLICPSCGYKLVRATGANIPENVLAFRCPNRHGYHFPAGELSKFKVAQEANIAYHRTWNIPLTSVAATLLMSLVGVILSAGLIYGVIGGQQQQNIVSQAQNIVSFQKAYVSTENKSITFIASTSVPTTLTLHIREMNYTNTLQSTDNKSHVIRVTNIESGTYTYYFSFDVDGKNIHTEDFTFLMP